MALPDRTLRGPQFYQLLREYLVDEGITVNGPGVVKALYRLLKDFEFALTAVSGNLSVSGCFRSRLKRGVKFFVVSYQTTETQAKFLRNHQHLLRSSPSKDNLEMLLRLRIFLNEYRTVKDSSEIANDSGITD